MAEEQCSTKCYVSQIGAQVLLFILLAGMAGSVDTEMLKLSVKTKWKGIMIGCACQFLLLPVCGFSSAKIFDLHSSYGIALIITTASPGGAYSNWWCSLMNADLALSLAMTTCSTLLAAICMPVNLLLWTGIAYGDTPSLELPKLLANIGVAITGILLGTTLSFCFPGRRRAMNIIGNVAGLGLIIFGAAFSSRDDPLWNKEGKFYIAVAAPCLLGLVAAFAIAFFSPVLSYPEVVAVTVETVYQNTGLALSICLASFSEGERGKAVGVPLYYGLIQIIILPLFLITSWQFGLTYAPRSTSCWRLLSEDWQPKLGGDDDDRSGSQALEEREVADDVKLHGVEDAAIGDRHVIGLSSC